jgi:hypothetical protein
MELPTREKTGPDHDQKAVAACYTFIEETNTWRRTGSLNRARYWFTMTTLGQNQTKPNHTKPNQTKPKQTKPNQKAEFKVTVQRDVPTK